MHVWYMHPPKLTNVHSSMMMLLPQYSVCVRCCRCLKAPAAAFLDPASSRPLALQHVMTSQLLQLAAFPEPQVQLQVGGSTSRSSTEHGLGGRSLQCSLMRVCCSIC
jgi:hypothetical protein